MLDARARKRRQQLVDTQDKLVKARVRLTRLERKQARAEKLLAENLRSSYMAGEPTFVTVVLNADGFSDLVERFEFLRRIARRNASVLGDTRDARIKVKGMTVDLKDAAHDLQRRWRATPPPTATAPTRSAPRCSTASRSSCASATAPRPGSSPCAARSPRSSAARRPPRAPRAASFTAVNAAPTPQSGGGGGGGGGGGDVVARVVAAANEIATTPYVWGGGHGGASGGYDCSGSISYALAAGGLLSSPLASGGFMSWGEPGPGRRITVYANAGHAFMVVDGRRYDTSALSGGGTRWTSEMRSTAGFVARHPPGF